MGLNSAFFLLIFGVLGIYCEFVWPGRVWQAVLGIAAAATGLHFLWRRSFTLEEVGLIGVAILCFALDAYIDTHFVLGMAGTGSLTAGFLNLGAGEDKIDPRLAILCCVAFGIVTTALNWAARRARHNKRNFAD